MLVQNIIIRNSVDIGVQFKKPAASRWKDDIWGDCCCTIGGIGNCGTIV